MGIRILPPDVNRSQQKFAPETLPDATGKGGSIRFGLAAIKNVGTAAMESAIAEREENGEVQIAGGLLNPARLQGGQQKRCWRTSSKPALFDFTGETRASMASRLDSVIASAASEQRDRQSGQGSLFDMMDLAAPAPVQETPSSGSPNIEEWSLDEILAIEKGSARVLCYRPSARLLSQEDRKREARHARLTGGTQGRARAQTSLRRVRERCRRQVHEAGRKAIRRPQRGGLHWPVRGDGLETMSTKNVARHWKRAPLSTCWREWNWTRVPIRGGLLRVEIKPIDRAKLQRGKRTPLPQSPNGSGDPSLASNGANGTGSGNGNGHRSLILHIDCTSTTEADLLGIRDVIANHRGGVVVELELKMASGQILLLETAEDFRVTDTPSLREQLAPYCQAG